MNEQFDLKSNEFPNLSDSHSSTASFREQAVKFMEEYKSELIIGAAIVATGAIGAVGIRAMRQLGAELAEEASAKSLPSLEVGNIAADANGLNEEGKFVRGHGPGAKYFYDSSGHESTFRDFRPLHKSNPGEMFVGAEHESNGDSIAILNVLDLP